MPNKKTKLATIEILPPAIKERKGDPSTLINAWHNAAKDYANATVLCAGLAGMELMRVKETLPHGEWLPWVQKNCEFGLTTTRKYMEVGQEILNRLMKLHRKSKNTPGVHLPKPDDFRRTLSTAPSALSPTARKQLIDLVAKVTDGETITEIYRELGIVKKIPRGHGGDTSAFPQMPRRTRNQRAQEFWLPIYSDMRRLLTHDKETLLFMPTHTSFDENGTITVLGLDELEAVAKENLKLVKAARLNNTRPKKR